MNKYKSFIFNSYVQAMLTNPGENLNSSNKDTVPGKLAEIAEGLAEQTVLKLQETIEKQTSNEDVRENFMKLLTSCVCGLLASPHDNILKCEKETLAKTEGRPLWEKESQEITFKHLTMVGFVTAQGITEHSQSWKW